MAQKRNTEKFITPVFTVVWPHLFEKYDYAGKEENAKYSCEMMFSPDAIKEMVECAKKVARAEWPEREFSQLRFPFRKGDEMADKAAQKGKNHDYYRGKIVMRAKTSHPIQIVEKTADGEFKDVIDPKRIFAGCKGVAEITFAAYENPSQGDGINVYLNMYCHVGEGDRIGRRDPRAVFADVTGGVSEVDPTMDDEIPF